MSSEEWMYVNADNIQQGPVEFGVLKELFASKAIDKKTYVWNEEMDGWEEIGNVIGLEAKLKAKALPVRPSITSVGRPLPLREAYVATVKMLYKYDGRYDDELNLPVDAIVNVIEKKSDGWYYGEYNGIKGLFPGNYCEGTLNVRSDNNVERKTNLLFGSPKAIDSISSDVHVVIKNKVVTGCDEGKEAKGRLIIPEGAEQIGSCAFSKCSGLTSIMIPNSVNKIGHNAFRDCSGLKAITILNSAVDAPYNIIEGCIALTNIDIKNQIMKKIIMELRTTGNVTIPTSITEIGIMAFSGCSRLTSISIPNSITKLGSCAFSHCLGLISINIPNSVIKIENSAFYNCKGLASIMIPDSVTEIESQAFFNCLALTSIMIPNSVTKIESQAFSHCSGLTSITILNPGVDAPYNIIEGCTALTNIDIKNQIMKKIIMELRTTGNVTIPNSMTKIEADSFYLCSGLKSINIPNSVTKIGKGAFTYCEGLISIIIPNSVIKIENSAFSDCKRLTSITIPNSVTEIGSFVFSCCKEVKTLNVVIHDVEGGKEKCEAIIKSLYLVEGIKINLIPDGTDKVKEIAKANKSTTDEEILSNVISSSPVVVIGSPEYAKKAKKQKLVDWFCSFKIEEEDAIEYVNVLWKEGFTSVDIILDVGEEFDKFVSSFKPAHKVVIKKALHKLRMNEVKMEDKKTVEETPSLLLNVPLNPKSPSSTAGVEYIRPHLDTTSNEKTDQFLFKALQYQLSSINTEHKDMFDILRLEIRSNSVWVCDAVKRGNEDLKNTFRIELKDVARDMSSSVNCLSSQLGTVDKELKKIFIKNTVDFYKALELDIQTVESTIRTNPDKASTLALAALKRLSDSMNAINLESMKSAAVTIQGVCSNSEAVGHSTGSVLSGVGNLTHTIAAQIKEAECIGLMSPSSISRDLMKLLERLEPHLCSVGEKLDGIERVQASMNLTVQATAVEMMSLREDTLTLVTGQKKMSAKMDSLIRKINNLNVLSQIIGGRAECPRIPFLLDYSDDKPTGFLNIFQKGKQKVMEGLRLQEYKLLHFSCEGINLDNSINCVRNHKGFKITLPGAAMVTTMKKLGPLLILASKLISAACIVAKVGGIPIPNIFPGSEEVTKYIDRYCDLFNHPLEGTIKSHYENKYGPNGDGSPPNMSQLLDKIGSDLGTAGSNMNNIINRAEVERQDANGGKLVGEAYDTMIELLNEKTDWRTERRKYDLQRYQKDDNIYYLCETHGTCCVGMIRLREI